MAKTHWASLAARNRACRAILKRANWDVRESGPGDQAQVLQLCQRLLGCAPTPAEWQWRMSQNPAGQAVSLVAYLKESGRIIGHLAAAPLNLKVGNFPRKLFLLVDSVVDPDYQGRGIHAVLTAAISKKVCDQEGNFTAGLPNEQAYGPNLKMGGTHIFTMPIYFKVLDWYAVLRAGLRSDLLARIGGLLAAPFQRKRLAKENTSFTLEKVLRFGGKLDDLWSRIGRRFPICAERTSNLLNWRYFQCPVVTYSVFAISDGEKWLGYTVVRLLEKWGLRLGTVVDLFIDPDRADAGEILLRYAEKNLRDQGTDVLWALFACPPVYRKILRQAGFFKAPPLKNVRPFHFLTDFVAVDETYPDLYQRDGTLLRQPDQWFFSLGDTDLA